MLEQADAIHLLAGWENSPGALREFDHAKQRGLLFSYHSIAAFTAAVMRFRHQKGAFRYEDEA
ncbi:MAG: DUF4406 domain-containing protein, partial [Candidatus Symbiopectobacterium sp. Dall1.0]|nr:DUF4406 domain-containing protein [Candidatus Symbiopectobacterium sp. Dall1.0]